MSKILQSFALFEIRLPAIEVGGRVLPEVTLPKGKYFRQEADRGGRPVVELNDDQVARVEADRSAMSMFSARKGGYRWLDKMPAHMRLSSDRIRDLEQENAKLRADLAAAQGSPASAAPPNESVEVVDVSAVDVSL